MQLLLLRIIFKSKLITMILGIVKANRSTAKSSPRNLISKRIIGILIEAQTQRNMEALSRLAPFFNRDTTIGKATYKGPIVDVPTRKETSIPFIPDAWPIAFSITLFGTQTSKRPIKMRIGGRIESISRR